MSIPVPWQLHSVPTIHNDSKSNPSLIRAPRKRKIGLDELVSCQAADRIVDIDSISEENSPENFTV